MKLHTNRVIRALVVPMLKRLNPGDITIAHHYTRQPFRLHSYRHKGYWFHGKNREKSEMAAFALLIRSGDTVFDVGGHIGYTALYFNELVGAGRVHVFEPGPNNLPYLRRNIAPCPGITLAEVGVGDVVGRLPMFIEDLTGQNNSLHQDFEGLKNNRAAAHDGGMTVQEVMISVTTLDAYVDMTGVAPDFIKVDVEGFELQVLAGARQTLAEHRPILMVEIQSDHRAVFARLSALGYVAHDPDLDAAEVPDSGTADYFFIPREKLFLLDSPT